MNKKGLVFYYDWLEQLSVLNDSDFRRVIAAIILYHKTQATPEPINPLADMALGFIIPQIARMKEKGANGKLGGRPKKSQEVAEADPVSRETEKNSTPQSEVPSSINNNDEICHSEEKKRPYGDFFNVLLTKDELEDLKQKFPTDYDKRINDLSYYIKSKGDSFASHYGAILNRHRYTASTGSSTSAVSIESTFDTDDFFSAALERSNRQSRLRREMQNAECKMQN